MNAVEIDALDGGELDEAVALHVMEWRKERGYWVEPNRELGDNYGYAMGAILPPYHSNLADAFEMAQYLAERIFTRLSHEAGYINRHEVNALTLVQCSYRKVEGAWMAAFQTFSTWPEEFEPEHLKPYPYTALATTAPLAICRAALKAVLDAH